MAAIGPLLAVEAMKDLHVYVVALVAVGAVSAGLIRVVRFRRRSATPLERDQGRGA